MRIMEGRRSDEEENFLVTMLHGENSSSSHTLTGTSFITPTTITDNNRTSSESSDVSTMEVYKSVLSPYRRKSFSTLTNFMTVLIVSSLLSTVFVGGDMVYIRSANFGQLVTSSTARWAKGNAKDPLTLKSPSGSQGVICRVYHTTLRGVGLVSGEGEGSICNIDTKEGSQGSDKYQTISQSASRLVWTAWKAPNPPPTGAVAVSVKPQTFLAADLNSTMIGYLDPTLHLGAAMFPNQPKPYESCLILTEIEPMRYELSDIQLKRNKGFIEEDIVLDTGKLSYKETDEIPDANQKTWDSSSSSYDFGMNYAKSETGKGKVETVLSYEKNSYDYWGQGYLMAKGLHTTIHMPDGSTKIVEWGLPLTFAGKTETMTAEALLELGTGINVTLHGTRLNGEMSYWANLKTIFKDGFVSTRLMDNHRKVIEIQDIRLENSRPYFLANNSIVPEPTTTIPTTTTTSTTTTTQLPYEDDDEGTEGVNALPVESNPHNMQADQSLHLMANGMKSATTSVALSHFLSGFLLLGIILQLRTVFIEFSL